MGEEEFRPFNEQTTYYGSLDDVVYRYPWGKEWNGRQLDLDAIRSQLVTAVIYDKTIVINDGYLIANPLISPDLTDTSRSIFGTMLNTKAAFLYSRNGDAKLEEGLERTAASGQGVKSHAAIMRDPKRWADMKWGLQNLDHLARGHVLAWPSDKNMGEAFYLLMKGIADRSGEDTHSTVPDTMRSAFDSIFRAFEDLLDESYDAARTKWEEVAWRHFLGRDLDDDTEGAGNFTVEQLRTYPCYNQVRVMMNLANERYHLAQSAGAARSIAQSPRHPLSKEGKTVGVFTALVDDHDRLLAPYGRVTDIAKQAALNQLTLSIPPELRFTGNFTFIERFFGEKRLNEARSLYLTQLHRFANDDGGVSFAAAAEARDDYARLIADALLGHVKAARSLNYAERLFDLILSYSTAPLDPVASWFVDLGQDSLKNILVERVAKRRIAVALREEGTRRAQAKPRQTRDEGLYVGPLHPPGIDQLLGKVGPHPKAAAFNRPATGPDQPA